MLQLTQRAQQRRAFIRPSRRAAQLSAAGACGKRQRSPRRAVQPNQPPLGCHGHGTSRLARLRRNERVSADTCEKINTSPPRG